MQIIHVNSVKMKLFSLSDANPMLSEFSAHIQEREVEDIFGSCEWEHFNQDDQLMWELVKVVFHHLVNEVSTFDMEEDQAFWTILNRKQKCFRVFGIFDIYVREHGVQQFLQDCPQYSYAILQAFEEMKFCQLYFSYSLILRDWDLRNVLFEANNLALEPTKVFDKRWKAFTKGYDQLTLTKDIDAFYTRGSFISNNYDKLMAFVKRNILSFVDFESERAMI